MLTWTSLIQGVREAARGAQEGRRRRRAHLPGDPEAGEAAQDAGGLHRSPQVLGEARRQASHPGLRQGPPALAQGRHEMITF